VVGDGEVGDVVVVDEGAVVLVVAVLLVVVAPAVGDVGVEAGDEGTVDVVVDTVRGQSAAMLDGPGGAGSEAFPWPTGSKRQPSGMLGSAERSAGPSDA